ncbi:MAG TPA: hypothetical protein VHG08_16665 [Longimicrobium sp.]|nr:hypothetical protein [Longimicrobium sp.]
MPIVTRTLKKGGDTGKLNRDEVRAVTLAIREGRIDEVLSGEVLQQARAAAKKNGGRNGHPLKSAHNAIQARVALAND